MESTTITSESGLSSSCHVRSYAYETIKTLILSKIITYIIETTIAITEPFPSFSDLTTGTYTFGEITISRKYNENLDFLMHHRHESNKDVSHKLQYCGPFHKKS